MKNDIIEELLTDLISKCESSMTSPFKKKAAKAVEVEEEPEAEVAIVSVDEPEEDDLDEDTMKKLMDIYRSKK